MDTEEVAVVATTTATTGGTDHVMGKILEVFDPIIDFLLWPIKKFVNWFYNRFLADKLPEPGPVYLPVRPMPTEMILYLPGL